MSHCVCLYCQWNPNKSPLLSSALSHIHFENPQDCPRSIAMVFKEDSLHLGEKFELCWGWTCCLLMQPNADLLNSSLSKTFGYFQCSPQQGHQGGDQGWDFSALSTAHLWTQTQSLQMGTWKWRCFLSPYFIFIFAILFRFIVTRGRSQLSVNVYATEHYGAQILLEAPRCCCYFYFLHEVTAWWMSLE